MPELSEGCPFREKTAFLHWLCRLRRDHLAHAAEVPEVLELVHGELQGLHGLFDAVMLRELIHLTELLGGPLDERHDVLSGRPVDTSSVPLLVHLVPNPEKIGLLVANVGRRGEVPARDLVLPCPVAGAVVNRALRQGDLVHGSPSGSRALTGATAPQAEDNPRLPASGPSGGRASSSHHARRCEG